MSFGLLQIPVSLFTAEKRSEEIHFRMLDKADLSPIRFERVNATTGEAVAWKDIVKGYELEPGTFVVIEPEELAKANVAATQTIEIQDFVPAREIATAFYETPYFVVPQKRATRAYALLRQALENKGAMAIATFVLRTRQALCALLPVGNAIMLEILRFGHELKSASAMPLPDVDALAPIPARELAMAEKLIGDMMVPWRPENYRDSYHADVMAIIEEKAKTGVVTAHNPGAPSPDAETVDLFELLSRSVAAQKERAAANDANGSGKQGSAPKAEKRSARPGPKKAARGARKKTAAA